MKKHLIIIPLQSDWKWTTDYQEQTAKILEHNNAVIFYNEYEATRFKQLFSKNKKKKIIYKKDGFYFYKPIDLIPFSRLKFVKNLNQLINYLLFFISCLTIYKKINLNTILWCFSPDDITLISLLNFSKVTLYDCVDNFSSKDAQVNLMIEEREKKLIKTVDFFFVNSQTLFSQKKNLREAIIVPQGFRVESFLPFSNLKSTDISKKKKITLGFIGGINYRIDYKLLIKIIESNPNKNIVLCGPIQEDHQDQIINFKKSLEKIKQFPNVTMLEKKKEEIPSVISTFDIGLIPYRMDLTFNRDCYPMKIFEYFYMGKPVISTSIKELQLNKFKNLIYTGDTTQQWQKFINTISKKDWSKEKQKKQRQLALDNSWSQKVKKIMREIEKRK